jgi:hypothetical protein
MDEQVRQAAIEDDGHLETVPRRAPDGATIGWRCGPASQAIIELRFALALTFAFFGG